MHTLINSGSHHMERNIFLIFQNGICFVFGLYLIASPVPRFNSCTHYVGAVRAEYTTGRPIAIQFPGNGCMDDLTTESSFHSQATWVINVLGLFFDILPIGVCTTEHWQTSGRLVLEFKVYSILLQSRTRLLGCSPQPACSG